MENLREILNQHNASMPLVFGNRYLDEDYMATGAIVLSKEALQRLILQSFPEEKKCDQGSVGEGNIELQKCMNEVKIECVDTRDITYRNRFFQEPVEFSLFPIVGQERINKLNWNF